MKEFKANLYLLSSPENLENLQLKDFFKLVESVEGRPPERFAFYGGCPNLHKNLEIAANIFLEAPMGTIKERNKKNASQLNFGGNIYVHQLYERLPFPDAMPGESGKIVQHLASVIRTILRPDPYLFLVCPQKYLDRTTKDLLASALKLENQLNHKTILIAGWPAQDWPLSKETAVMTVGKDAQNRPYMASIDDLAPNATIDRKTTAA